MASHIAIMARPTVVSGRLAALREASIPVSMLAAIMVTGQARLGRPQLAQAMAT